jgi:hypothetical protein
MRAVVSIYYEQTIYIRKEQLNPPAKKGEKGAKKPIYSTQ